MAELASPSQPPHYIIGRLAERHLFFTSLCSFSLPLDRLFMPRICYCLGQIPPARRFGHNSSAWTAQQWLSG